MKTITAGVADYAKTDSSDLHGVDCETTDCVALVSTADEYSWNIQVDSVPEGFKAIQFGDGSNFYCSSCDRPVEP
jgi:hypothetical protein